MILINFVCQNTYLSHYSGSRGRRVINGIFIKFTNKGDLFSKNLHFPDDLFAVQREKKTNELLTTFQSSGESCSSLETVTITCQRLPYRKQLKLYLLYVTKAKKAIFLLSMSMANHLVYYIYTLLQVFLFHCLVK